MVLDVVLAAVVVVDAAMLAVAALLVVGREQLAALRAALPGRLREHGRSLGLLAGVLLVNGALRDFISDVSWMFGWEVTSAIYAIEGDLVAQVQTVASPELTVYFGFMYVFGYVFLLVFPLVAYLALADPAPLRRTAVAYSLNYVVGFTCYVLFVAYGPRNLMPDAVAPLLYETYPETQLLTSEVNTNTNVFPSLHTSLSVTAALLAYQTRETYPYWTPVAALFAGSIALSTMYLGIHWGTDVVAGVALGVASVAAAGRLETQTNAEPTAEESTAGEPAAETVPSAAGTTDGHDDG